MRRWLRRIVRAMRSWRPDRNEEEPYADGWYLFTSETAKGERGEAAWVARCKNVQGVTYWFCLKDKSKDCEHATRATLASYKST